MRVGEIGQPWFAFDPQHGRREGQPRGPQGQREAALGEAWLQALGEAVAAVEPR